MECYTWPDNTYMAAAQAALDALNNHPALPAKGEVLGSTNEDPDSYTTAWHPQVDEYTTGKIGFPRIPANRLDWLEARGYPGTDQASRDAYLAAYITGTGGMIETYDPSWTPAPDPEEL